MSSDYQQQSNPSNSGRVMTVSPSDPMPIRPVTLVVAGQRITIRTDQSEDHLNLLCSEVNALMEALRQDAPSATQPQLMALSMLQLVDRAVCAEKAMQQGNLKIERHIERLSGILRSLDEADMQQ